MAGGAVSEDGDVGFQIAPMVDVVFVLLLFFMASAGSQVIEKELNTSLPGGPPRIRYPRITPLVIDIFADGRVLMNDKSFDSPASDLLPELRAKLKAGVAKYGDKDPVILRPAPETEHKRIMEVLNAVSTTGVTKLSFN